MKKNGVPIAKARLPPSGAGRAGAALVGIDWGRRKKHTACVATSKVKVVKFKDIQELVRKVPPPAAVFAEAAGPYLDFCALYEAYEVYQVDTRLVAERRRNSNTKKNDENDARILLEIGEDFLAGRLSRGVWVFEPDPLRRAVREAERLFRAWQKLRGYPEWAEELKREYRKKVREALELARKTEEFQKAVEVLGFGKNSLALATLVAELRGRKYGKQALLVDAGFSALSAKKRNGICPVTKTKKCTPACRHGKYSRRLHRAAMSLAEMAVVHKVQPWYSLYREFKKARRDKAAKNRLATRILLEVAKAVGALE